MTDAAKIEARVGELVRIMAKVAAGDFSEKPEIVEADDDVAKFQLTVRFMIDDLEEARAQDAKRRSELEAANVQLRELSEMKTRFINTAAHELNTPLTPIGLQLHMLRSGMLGPMTDRQAKAVDLIGRNLERLSHLVGDVLDAARLQAEHMRLVRKPTQVRRICEDAGELLRPQAEAAGVALAIEPGPDTVLLADTQRVTQVVFNLLTNALKFTPSGGSVRMETSATPTEWRLRVVDTGSGLTREQQARLFLPFSQVHDPTRHNTGGTGLGLFISRGIVEQHGGRMWCESEGPGRGSTFCVALPLHPPLATGAVEFPSIAASAGASPSEGRGVGVHGVGA